jgi:hypothetical protein
LHTVSNTFFATVRASNFTFSLNAKKRFGSFDETAFLDRLDAELSSSAGFLLDFDRVDGPLEEEGSRI